MNQSKHALPADDAVPPALLSFRFSLSFDLCVIALWLILTCGACLAPWPAHMMTPIFAVTYSLMMREPHD